MNSESGKIALYSIVVGVLVFGFAVAFDPFKFSTREPHSVWAGTATTSVTVLNTPPEWLVDAEEYVESSTSTPTDVGSSTIWVGTASDSNNEQYYLLICKTSSTPTANAGAAPTCGGGAGNQWAVSSLTNASVQATSTRTALAPDAEENVWVAWICDRNASNPKCNTTFKQGTGVTASPFYVNHRPSFTVAADDSPKDPSQVVTITTTASDSDVVTTSDTVRLFVCKANDYATSSVSCGAGGTYCSSSLSASNPTCNFTASSTLPDGNYNAFAFVIDNHNFPASGGAHATNTVVTINNKAPAVSSSSISLNDTDLAGGLTLGTGGGQTTGFSVKFTVTDENSCQNLSSGNEISSSSIYVYRSGIGQGSCLTTGNYNPNNCYPGALPTSTWNYSCSQDGGTCSGITDPSVNWTCTFPLWFLADPTDGTNATDSQFFAQDWLASVIARDDNGATSTITEASTGNEVISYLSYVLNTTLIAYGSLEPGQLNDPIVATTTVAANGNVGLDETLYGDGMCTTYPACGGGVTSTISINAQHFATSSVGYNSSTAFIATSSPGTELEINILKTTATSSLATGTTYWGIQIPITITLAGDYTGKNTIIGVKGEAQNW
jgi:hypothetical protein